MADIFYFNGPPTSLPPRKRPPPSDAHLKIPRKRRMADVDMLTQRACVARYEEPTFCPSTESALFSHESILYIAAATNSDAEPMCLEEDYDDGTGGVALPPNYYHCSVNDGLRDVLNAGPAVPASRETKPVDDMDSCEWPEPPTSVPGTSSCPDQHHLYSPPETSDVEDHQSGGRVRRALDGPPDDGVEQFNLSAALPHHLLGTENRPIHEQRNASSFITTPSVPTRHASPTTSAAAPGQPTPPLNRILADEESYSISTPYGRLALPLDDDALAVDDPRRHYDFADFMDSWRLRSLQDRRLPRFEPGPQPSVQLGQARDVTRKQVRSGAVDMQGLRWKLIGPRRDQATSARAILHPSSLDAALLSSRQELTTEERQYRFRSFNSRHRAEFNHYQLRNVLAASSRNEVFYAAGSRVQHASYACPTIRDTVMDLSKPSNCAADVRITCLSASRRGASNNSVLLAGGFGGEYALLHLDSTSQRPHEGLVTNAYNGLVTHIHNFADRRSGLLQAAFCSNDCTMRLMDVGTLRFTNTFRYDSSVNCSATSPDGRLRVLVGDSREVLITDASRGHTLVTLPEQSDHGFACDWSPDGRYVAAAAQDGKTVICDSRNWSEPVRTLHSSMSCVRSLHFTDNGALVAAENDDIVKIYDGGDFKICQDVSFFGSIAGVALLDGGEEMTIANADKTVGGLFTFERAAEGSGNGPYGRMIAPAGDHTRGRRRQDGISEFMDDTVV